MRKERKEPPSPFCVRIFVTKGQYLHCDGREKRIGITIKYSGYVDTSRDIGQHRMGISCARRERRKEKVARI